MVSEFRPVRPPRVQPEEAPVRHQLSASWPSSPPWPPEEKDVKPVIRQPALPRAPVRAAADRDSLQVEPPQHHDRIPAPALSFVLSLPFAPSFRSVPAVLVPAPPAQPQGAPQAKA